MKILFVMRTTLYVRNFESALRLLADRGHEVRVVGDVHHVLDPTNLMARLAAEYPGITHVQPPEQPLNGWSLLGDEIRRGVDYLRYLRPEYRDAPKLRLRAEIIAPPFVVAAAKGKIGGSAAGVAALSRTLRVIDKALPIDPAVMEFVRQQQPDVLLVTPLIEPGAPQSQYLRSARALGIRTGLCVYSWDNLTNKGLIQDPLDLVTVWNEPMKHEGITLHGIPAERIAVTGAPGYDHWFTWKPRQTRAEFCAQVGLPDDRPYLLYLCSSKFIAPREVAFVRQWITTLREASPLLARTGVLIRPHPQNVKPWQTAEFGDLEAVRIWPREGANPVDSDSRAEYYDSIFHSVGVVGVNTSAQIESAIVGRGVFTVLAPEYRDTQEGTLHFRHLREVNGGMLHVAETYPEHISHLEGAVRGEGADDGRCRRFIEAFVRPHGIDVPATPRLIAAIEELGARPAPRPERPPAYAGLVRARLQARSLELVREEEQRREEALEKERGRELKAARRAKKESGANLQPAAPAPPPPSEAQQATHTEAPSADGTRANVANGDSARPSSKAPRVADLVSVFEDVRDRVRAMKELLPPTAERPEFAPVWNATPDTLSTLRHFSHLAGGVHPDDYATPTSEERGQFIELIRRLKRDGTEELLVPESKLLGGFGFKRSGSMYNGDTVKFFEVLSALQMGGVLGMFRGTDRRPVLWDLAGRWGGFAYQFKTLFPNATYVMSGPPDTFLLSATYLRLMFPSARVRFYGDRPNDELWRDLTSADFIFVPDSLVCEVRPERLDLAIDVFALEQMPRDAAERLVRHAASLAATFFYSVVPGDLDGPGGHVRPALESCYWLHRLPIPKERPVFSGWRPDAPDVARPDRAHVVGWKKLLP